ncbi:HigA family addiction module antitoxin [soil metagenome]|jgi:addiction module HigA family antidote|nr:HigA family addiction module antidote protein [Rubrobacter sp.]MDQ3360601.1 HigA family addiction module antitoxin [Actinomycetota bacterium]
MGGWTEEIRRETRTYAPVHPGEVLKQEWLEPLGMNPNRLAKALGVDRQSIYDIVGGKRGISADMALRLARWSGMRPAFWIGLQTDHDLQVAEWKRGQKIAEQVEPLAPAP